MPKKMELEVLRDKQTKTKKYIDHVIKYCNKVEGAILQNDRSSQIEEKVVSIGIATVFMWLVGIFLTFTGAGIILFLIGLVLSRVINLKIYGKPRNVEKLSCEEKKLLEMMHSNVSLLKGLKIKVGLASKRNQFLFTDYPIRKAELTKLIKEVSNLDIRHLSLKYRTVYSNLTRSTLANSKKSLFVHLDDAYKIKRRKYL